MTSLNIIETSIVADVTSLIEAADHFCSTLDYILLNDKKFCEDVGKELEVMSYEIFKLRNEISEARHGILLQL